MGKIEFIGWTVYMLGYLLTYKAIKNYRDKHKNNMWEDIIFTIILSLCSWLGLFIWYISMINLNKVDFKPPKWL